MKRLLLSIMALTALAVPAFATSGPGCLVVVNVAKNDALNMRARPRPNRESWTSWFPAGTASSTSTASAGPNPCPGGVAGAR